MHCPSVVTRAASPPSPEHTVRWARLGSVLEDDGLLHEPCMVEKNLDDYFFLEITQQMHRQFHRPARQVARLLLQRLVN